MEWKLSDERKMQYESLLKAAQDLESTIGSSMYRLQKLLDMRKELDSSLKNLWEKLAEELNLDKSIDYIIDRDGTVRDVPRKVPGQTELHKSMVGSNATELK